MVGFHRHSPFPFNPKAPTFPPFDLFLYPPGPLAGNGRWIDRFNGQLQVGPSGVLQIDNNAQDAMHLLTHSSPRMDQEFWMGMKIILQSGFAGGSGSTYLFLENTNNQMYGQITIDTSITGAVSMSYTGGTSFSFSAPQDVPIWFLFHYDGAGHVTMLCNGITLGTDTATPPAEFADDFGIYCATSGAGILGVDVWFGRGPPS